mgnify:CR=1 FL=1
MGSIKLFIMGVQGKSYQADRTGKVQKSQSAVSVSV